MRRATMFLSFVGSAVISLAQVQPKAQPSSHLSFNGVSIDGTLCAYVSKMEEKGFAKVNAVDGYALLSGEYATYQNCYVHVESLKQKNVVSKIALMFPYAETWSTLSFNYNFIKDKLIAEYGQPVDFVEKFKGETPADDKSKMDAVKMNSSDYYATFETPEGSIQLSIEHDRSQRCFVRLAYYDRINGNDM